MYSRFPSRDLLYTIYCSIITQHSKPVLGDIIVQLAINFRDKTLSAFLPKAIMFPYLCNLREMTKVKS